MAVSKKAKASAARRLAELRDKKRKAERLGVPVDKLNSSKHAAKRKTSKNK